MRPGPVSRCTITTVGEPNSPPSVLEYHALPDTGPTTEQVSRDRQPHSERTHAAGLIASLLVGLHQRLDSHVHGAGHGSLLFVAYGNSHSVVGVADGGTLLAGPACDDVLAVAVAEGLTPHWHEGIGADLELL